MELWQYDIQDNWPKLRDSVDRAFGKDEIDQTCRLFCPPGLYPQFSLTDIYVLLAYLREGLFKRELFPPYQPSSDCSGISVISRTSAETGEHLKLKQLATAWLIDQGVNDIEYEAALACGECDLASKDRKWIIECGATRPSKVIDYLPENPTSKFVVFNRLGIGVFTSGPTEIVQQYLRLQSDYIRKMLKKMPPIL